MTRAALLFVLALGGGLARAQTPAQAPVPEQVISLDRFDQCGFISRYAPNKIDPQCFQGLNNAVLDQDFSILRRNGYAAYLTSPCSGLQAVRGEWPFYGTDGSQYLLVLSSNTLFSSKGDGTCTPITGLTNLSASATMSCVQGMGYEWCTDGVDPVFQTNVTSTATVVQAPTGKYIGFFRNRLMIAGVSGFLTQVYLSGELNGTDWTLPTVTYSTSPAILNISGTNDGQSISCLMGEFQNGYYIGRNYDTYLLSGYDLRDFGISKVDQQIGCMDNNSPQMVNNTLMWLSHRGIESLSGTQINWVSAPIDPTIKVIIQAAGNSQAFTVNNANFTQGNLTASGPGAPISSTIFPGNLTVSSATYTDNSTSTFVNGSLVNVSTYGAAQLALTITSNTVAGGNMAGSGFVISLNESGSPVSAGTANGSTFSTGASGACSGTKTISCPFSQAFCSYIAVTNGCIDQNYQTRVSVWDGATGSLLGSTGIKAANTTLVVPIGTVATSSSVYICFSMASDPTNGTCATGAFSSMVKEAATTPVGWNVLVDVNSTFSGYNIGTFGNVRVSSYPPTGTYTSATFDTTFSTPTMGTVTVGVSSNAVAGLTLQQETSTNGSAWSAPSALPNPSQATGGSRYWRYLENYTTTSGTVTATSTGLGTLVAETTGYYITPCVNTAGNMSYGVFSVNGVTNGGSFSFWISTGATCGAAVASTNTFTAQTPNSIITASTAPYIAARVLFNVDIASEAPSINNLAFNWNSGASRPPVASAQYLNKYYLFYTTSQVAGAANDHAVVYDQNAHWQLLDDVHAASAVLYLNQLFLGDSQATGKIYLYDSGQDDAGQAFTFSFQTPDLDGGDPLSYKTFKRAYLILSAPSPTTLSGTVSCSYALSGSPTTYSLGTVSLSEAPEQGGYFVAKLPFPASSPTTGQWVSLSCSNSGTVGPLRVYGVRLVYTKNDWP